MAAEAATASSPHQCPAWGALSFGASAMATPAIETSTPSVSGPADALAPSVRRQQQRQQREELKISAACAAPTCCRPKFIEGDEHTELPYAQRCHGPQVAAAHAHQPLQANGNRQQTPTA
jgi:hypothetical protein